MLKELEDFIKKLPSTKQINLLKNNKSLYNWVIKTTENKLYASSSLSERVYLALHPNFDNTCCPNKSRRFISINKGYSKYCGKARTCEKCKKGIGKEISKTKKNLDRESKDIINKKREATMMKRYKVKHNSHLPGRKEHLKELYKDKELCMYQDANHMNTMFDKYGVFHQMDLKETKDNIKNTNLKKYGVEHPMKLEKIINKVLDTKGKKYPNGYLSKIWGYDKFKKTLLLSYGLELLCEREEYQGSYQTNKFNMKCTKCGYTFKASATYTDKTRCRICYPTEVSFASIEENEVFEYISKDLGIACYQRDKSIINPFELDIVIPSKNIAIEYCGLYWHSENSLGKGRQYHLKKHILAEEAGYRLITIYSDEWNLKKELTKNTLKFILGKEENKIFAKQTDIRKLKFKEIKSFLKTNHLQGSGNHTSINYGLFYKNELVSCMTFSKPRKLLGGKDEPDIYELVRFCSSGNVVGAASRLFQNFKNDYNPQKIISYCDKRWFTGKLYEQLGFLFLNHTEPGYTYTDKTQRFSRTAFTKKSLVKEGFDARKSEWEIMQERGFDRIWDCGNYKFVWTKK